MAGDAIGLGGIKPAGELLGAADADEAAPLCLDAVEGELCHRLVVWAMEDGFRFDPEHFQGLSRASPFHAFQQAVHRRNPEFCPPPCPRAGMPLPVAAAAHAAASVPSLVPARGGRGGCNYGHVDSAPANAGCFVVHEGRLLTELDGVRYAIPGGQTDWHEPSRCTAHRGTLEKTGRLAAPRGLLAVARDGSRIYRCELLRRSPIRGHDLENSRAVWMTPDEVRATAEHGLFHSPEAARFADWMR